MYLLDGINIKSDPALALTTLANLCEYEQFAEAIVKTGIPALKSLLHPLNPACFHALKLLAVRASHTSPHYTPPMHTPLVSPTPNLPDLPTLIV